MRTFHSNLMGGTPMPPSTGVSPMELMLRVVLVASVTIVATLGRAAITEVGAIGLSVADLDRQIAFYTQVLPFESVSESTAEGDVLERLHALPNVRARSATLRLGQETITLTEFERPRGASIPSDSRSYDHWFQHIAIVVSDMDAAYAHLRKHGVKHVSTGPQTLPAWNPDAGGIKAFYFRDPEDHVLEVIWFPPGKGEPRWQQPSGGRLFLGIDHTAIVVRDTERSLAFYRDALGLVVAGGAENHGIEQEHLNQVFGARLRITALRAPRGPGVEFLEYLTPPGGRALPPDARTVDLLAWTTGLRSDSLDTDIRTSEDRGGRRISLAGERMLVRDPDGHLLLIGP